MRVLLLAINTAEMPYPVFPLGAAVMYKAIQQAGHTVKLVDLKTDLPDGEYYSHDSRTETIPASVHSLLQDSVYDFSPDCIGISLRNLESVNSFNFTETWSLDRLRFIIEILRKVSHKDGSKIPIVLGGPGFSLLPDPILDYVGADAGVIGGGEEVFIEALEKFSSGTPFPRLMKGTSMPRIQGAYYGDLAKKYSALGGFVGIQSRRGCSYSCSYCCYPMLEGRKVVARPVEEVIADIRILYEQHGISEFSFADAVFNDMGGKWRTLAKALADSAMPVRWTAFFQPHGLDANDFKLLQKAGVMGCEFGTDASSDATLRGINKPFTMKNVLGMQEICSDFGIPAIHYMIFGGPGESMETVTEGLENIEKFPDSVVMACSGISLHKGTEVYKKALAEGIVSPDDSLIYPRYYFAPGLDREAMEAMIASSFKKRRDRIFPPSQMDMKMRAVRRMGIHGMLWDTLLPGYTKRTT